MTINHFDRLWNEPANNVIKQSHTNVWNNIVYKTVNDLQYYIDDAIISVIKENIMELFDETR